MVDASPQAKHEYFLTKCEEIQRDMRHAGEHKDPLRGFAWLRHSMPVTVLGKGQTSTSQKFDKLVHSATLVAGESGLDTWRREVRGFTTDQGTERKIRQCPISHSAEGRDRLDASIAAVSSGAEAFQAQHDSFFFPNALEMTGHLHVFWNSFQKGCLSFSEDWPLYDSILRCVCKLVGNLSNSQCFIANCMQMATASEKHLVEKTMGEHLDWRWEHLEEVSQQVTLVLPILRKYWRREVWLGDGVVWVYRIGQLRGGHLGARGHLGAGLQRVDRRVKALACSFARQHDRGGEV